MFPVEPKANKGSVAWGVGPRYTSCPFFAVCFFILFAT